MCSKVSEFSSWTPVLCFFLFTLSDLFLRGLAELKNKRNVVCGQCPMTTGKIGPRSSQRKDISPLLPNLMEDYFPISFLLAVHWNQHGYTGACWGEKLLLVMTAVKQEASKKPLRNNSAFPKIQPGKSIIWMLYLEARFLISNYWDFICIWSTLCCSYFTWDFHVSVPFSLSNSSFCLKSFKRQKAKHGTSLLAREWW